MTQEVQAEGGAGVAAGRGRIPSIDMVRGLVIVLMILDHVRDFFGPATFSPTDIESTTIGFFMTRWVTHLCAPVFVLLAGLGTALFESKGRSKHEVSRFLWTRGLWLIALELVVVNLSWTSYFYGFFFVQVIWVLGLSMIALAGLIYVPRRLLGALAILMVVGQHVLEALPGGDSLLWSILYGGGFTPLGGIPGVSVVYPLIPWPAVMALGYLMGSVYRMEAPQRRRWLLRTGAALTVAFIVLRWFNGYGDPSPWSVQERGGIYTALSYLNATKYPASLSFLLMTLGPGLILLALFEHLRGWPAKILDVFGKVPLFLYLVHIPLAHLLAVGYWWVAHGWPFRVYAGSNAWPESYEPNLWVIYIAWICITAMLYPLCAWFASVKARRREWWLRYL